MFSGQILNKISAFEKVAKTFPEFRYLGNPILRTPTSIVTLEEGKAISVALEKVLIKYRELLGYGRGLSANQIGIPKSVFITYLDNQIQTYINPEIVKFYNQQCLYRELCLSSGFIWADIKRPAKIILEWISTTGEPMQEIFTEGKARLIQHEYEHLLGKYSLDHAEPNTLELCLSDPLQEKLRPI